MVQKYAGLERLRSAVCAAHNESYTRVMIMSQIRNLSLESDHFLINGHIKAIQSIKGPDCPWIMRTGPGVSRHARVYWYWHALLIHSKSISCCDKTSTFFHFLLQKNNFFPQFHPTNWISYCSLFMWPIIFIRSFSFPSVSCPLFSPPVHWLHTINHTAIQ